MVRRASKLDRLASGSASLRWLAVTGGLFAAFGGLTTLVGWITGQPRFLDWVLSGITMKFNAALAATLAGAGLLVVVLRPSWRPILRGLALLLFALASLTLLQHLTGANFGIDELFVREAPGARATSAPGRMGPPASTSFTLLAISLWLATGSRRSQKYASALAIVVAFGGLLSAVGYLFGASRLYTLATITGIAFQTAIMIIGVAVGMVAALPEVGVAAAFRRPDAGGIVLRRLAIPIVAIPIALGWLLVRGQQTGLYDPAFEAAAFALLTIFSLLGLTVWCANGIGRLSEAEQESRRALETANAELEKRVEARTADLVAKVSELEGFCYSVSHDMRAPLRAMVGNARMVLEDESERLSDDGKARLRALEAAAKKMAMLVDDLLMYARLGQQHLVRHPCDLSDIAEKVADEVKRSHEGVTATLHIQPGMHSNCDPRLAGLVLHNLIDNAIKYVAPGQTAHVEVGMTSDGSFFVRDNGIGFDMRYADRVFKAFERLHRDSEYPGTGIGLANVQRIVERHGGRIWVESAPGEGTAFFFTFDSDIEQAGDELTDESLQGAAG